MHRPLPHKPEICVQQFCEMHSLNPMENKRKLHPGGVNSGAYRMTDSAGIPFNHGSSNVAGGHLQFALFPPPPSHFDKRVSWLEFGCTPLKLRSVGRPDRWSEKFLFSFSLFHSVRSFLARSHQQYANTYLMWRQQSKDLTRMPNSRRCLRWHIERAKPFVATTLKWSRSQAQSIVCVFNEIKISFCWFCSVSRPWLQS